MMLRSFFFPLIFFSLLKGFATDERIEIINSSSDPFQKIEIYLYKPEQESSSFLLFLHGASNDAGLSGIAPSWYDHWQEKGYAVSAISMPGFGKSAGVKDFCGPLTLRSLNVAVDCIKQEFGASDLGIIGFGQGATAALLLAAQRSDVRCLVSANGVYDLVSHLGPEDSISKALIAKKYAIAIAPEDFKIRSPIENVRYIKTPVFVLHRDNNPMVSPDEANKFVEMMKQEGRECRFSLLLKTENSDVQKLSYDEILQETETWVDRMMNLSL